MNQNNLFLLGLILGYVGYSESNIFGHLIPDSLSLSNPPSYLCL